MKSTRLFLGLLFFISFCSNSSTPISVSSLDGITGFTTNKIEISNSDWDNYIGKSSNGNFVALRVDIDIVDDGVLIVFTVFAILRYRGSDKTSFGRQED